MRLALVLLAALSCAAGVALGAAHDPSAPTVALTVRYDAGPSRPETRSTLRCTGTTATGTGRLRDRAVRACRTARDERRTLHGARSEGPCTELFGGPQQARVVGTIGRTRVARRFTRADGCRIAEWDALVPLLPRTRGATP